IRRINSLMARFNSLLGRNKFPVPMRRELGRKPLNSAIDFEPIVALGGLDEQNSLYFPREFGSRDGFARDCLLHQRVRCEPDSLDQGADISLISTATSPSAGGAFRIISVSHRPAGLHRSWSTMRRRQHR